MYELDEDTQIAKYIRQFINIEREIFELWRIMEIKPTEETSYFEFAEKYFSAEHGHILIIRLLFLLKQENLEKEFRVLEIGSTRELNPEQCSTFKIGLLASMLGIDFYSVDMDCDTIERNLKISKRLSLDINLICDTGEKFILSSEKDFYIMYLDSFDYDHGQHSDKRKRQYQKYLGLELNQDNCDLSNLNLAQSILGMNKKPMFIVYDDVWSDEKDWQGKGKMAIPALLDNGYKIWFQNLKTVILQKLN